MKKFLVISAILAMLISLVSVSVVFNWPWCYLQEQKQEEVLPEETQEKQLKWVNDYSLGNPILCRFTIQDCESYNTEDDCYLSYVFTFATCPTTDDTTNHIGSLSAFSENYYFLFEYMNMQSQTIEKAYCHISVRNIVNEDGSRNFGISSEYLDLDFNELEFGIDHNIIGGNYMYLMEI